MEASVREQLKGDLMELKIDPPKYLWGSIWGLDLGAQFEGRFGIFGANPFWGIDFGRAIFSSPRMTIGVDEG